MCYHLEIFRRSTHKFNPKGERRVISTKTWSILSWKSKVVKHMIRTRKLYDLRTVGNTVFNLSTKGYIYSWTNEGPAYIRFSQTDYW